MKLAWTFVLVVMCAAAMAQDQIPERLLISTGQYLGPGARAQGLAGAFTGVADDFSAVWWNPAGLAQVKRIEMQGSLARSGYANEATYLGATTEDKVHGMRMNDAGMVFPVPVYQGALSFAFGYSQIQAFDRSKQFSDPSLQSWSNFDILEKGRLGFWTLAGAVDVSPNLALGMGLQYWRGRDEYSFVGDSAGSDYEETIETGLSSLGANFGGLFRAGRFARIGATFQTPISVKIDEEYDFGVGVGTFDYTMNYPAVFRAGASVSPGRWLLAADIEYRDWTSLEFKDETPYTDVSKAEANRQIKNDYQSTTCLSVGGEYLFPAYGTRARAGYSFTPSNFRKAGGDDDQHILAVGAGVLVDRSVMLDVAYRFSSYKQQFSPDLAEKVHSSAVLFSLSYRL